MLSTFKLLVGTFALPAIVLGAACGMRGDSPGTPAPAATATASPASAVNLQVIELATQPATQVTVVNPAPATATAAPAEPPPAVQEPLAVELPQVLSMRSDHAGPGLIILRFSTNVPVTADVQVMSNQSGPAFSWSETLDSAATEHEISIPANFGRYVVRIEDEFGNEAWGSLRYAADPQGIDFDNAPYAPALKAQTAKKLLVTWGFADGHPSSTGDPGRVVVFTKDAGCTTIDACVGEPTGPAVEGLVEHNPEADYHTVLATIPGSAFDYQVVIAQPLTDDASHVAFMQLEIRGDQLPKTNFAGPKTITR